VRANTVKRKLQAGGVSLGTMGFEFTSQGVGRIVASAGAEYIIYDMEHTGWSIETIRNLIATTRAADTIPMVRVPATQYNLISRPLDVGAMGIMVPMVETAEQAELIAKSTKYPPAGIRGCAFGVAHDDYTGGDVLTKMQSSNEEIFVIAQIETKLGLENAAEIAAVEGIDCLWIGHFDLTTSLGIPAQWDHPLFQDAVDRVISVCNEHGVVPGIMGGSVEDSIAWVKRGFRAVAYSGDLWVFQKALADGLTAIRQATGAS
jgi:2-dehydro-3-deoxyglucarate aldolase/4-hydroxy-2-oxoheptanedioate aldolase